MKFSINLGLFALATSVAAVIPSDLGIDIDLSKADHTCTNGQLKCCGVFQFVEGFTGVPTGWVEKIVGSPLQTTVDLDPSRLGFGTFEHCVDLPLIGNGELLVDGGLLQSECPDNVACCHEGDEETSGPDGVLGFLVNTAEDLETSLAILNPSGV